MTDYTEFDAALLAEIKRCRGALRSFVMAALSCTPWLPRAAALHLHGASSIVACRPCAGPGRSGTQGRCGRRSMTEEIDRVIETTRREWNIRTSAGFLFGVDGG